MIICNITKKYYINIDQFSYFLQDLTIRDYCKEVQNLLMSYSYTTYNIKQ